MVGKARPVRASKKQEAHRLEQTHVKHILFAKDSRPLVLQGQDSNESQIATRQNYTAPKPTNQLFISVILYHFIAVRPSSAPNGLFSVFEHLLKEPEQIR